MGITDSLQQNELQLMAQVTDSEVAALRLGFDVEVWSVSPWIADSPGEAAYDVFIEADTGQGYAAIAQFNVTTGAVLLPPERGSRVDGNADGNRLSFAGDVIPAELPAGSQVRVRWAAPAGSLTEGWVYGLDNVQLTAFGHLQAGDADQDYDFDQFDLVRVQQASKYLSGEAATWGEGDWNGAPGGFAGSPPGGDGSFNQLDVIAALSQGNYLAGPYAGTGGDGKVGPGGVAVGYNRNTGEIWIDAPAGGELTSVSIDSASGMFTGAAAGNLSGSFDNHTHTNIFKATFGSSFGSLSFGSVAQPGLTKDFVTNDLSVVGSLAGGGELSAVRLVYVPEPSTLMLIGLGVVVLLIRAHGVQPRRPTPRARVGSSHPCWTK